MNATQFKAAIAGMSDADLCEVIDAFGHAHDHAVQMRTSARLPESAAFGAIGRDLDYGLGIIRQSAPEGPAAKDMDADGLPTTALVTFVANGGQEATSRP
ncbi:hypothetical protein [Paracoccus hibiscisoli]|uniref:Uncharacterized protein n=1 Tax=Paracoccus hibiscisoli TaxID=2023261 RepID=A0A4U0Q961_9RHOB|nr:hypothetical protein [Paracoccus hibiscisoli]TJZ76882.1 hypothetical protein FA740_19200 [Paracoccus hibiscisoli]